MKKLLFVLLVGVASIAAPCEAAAVTQDAESLSKMVLDDFLETTEIYKINPNKVQWLATYNYFWIQHKHHDVPLATLQSDEYTDLVLRTSGLVCCIYGHFLFRCLGRLEGSKRVALVPRLALVLGSISEKFQSVDLRDANVRAQYRALVQTARSTPRDTPRRAFLMVLVDRIDRQIREQTAGWSSWACSIL